MQFDNYEFEVSELKSNAPSHVLPFSLLLRPSSHVITHLYDPRVFIHSIVGSHSNKSTSHSFTSKIEINK